MAYYSQSARTNALAAMNGQPAAGGRSWVEAFEEAFASRLDVPYAIAMNSGTSAIHAGLAALGVDRGGEVISPALTVVMDSFATLYLGARPVFADIDPHTWLVDPADVEAKITDRTQAVIVVSWFGAPVDMRPFNEISQKYGIPLLDDSAETLFARSPSGRFAGTEADFGVFSFEQKKHMTTGGEGGMLVTSSKAFAERARKFAGIGYRHLTAAAGRTSLDSSVFHDPSYQRFDSVGFNYRMTPISAAIGIGQLDEIDDALFWRRQCARSLLEVISGCEWLTPQREPLGAEHAYYTLGLRYDGDLHHGHSWQDFYAAFVRFGGDGFYGNCLNPFREPVFETSSILTRVRKTAMASAPIAVGLQPRLMAFKTNYRSDIEIDRQGQALTKAIQWCESA